MIIHINGNPGVGKLTVARAFCEQTGARLIDNHLIVNLAAAVTDRSTNYVEMLLSLTAMTYDYIARTCTDRTIVFTNALARGSTADEGRLTATAELATRMNRPFVPVLLSCEMDENARRIVSPDRAHRRKLMDPKILRELAAQCELAHDPLHPNQLTIDTTHLQPTDVVAQMVAHAAKIQTG